MTRRLHARLRRDRTGASAIEFAIGGPVFLLLVFGIIEFGILLYANAGMRQGVSAAARYATLYPRPSEAQIKQRVIDSAYGLHPAQIDQTYPRVTYGTAGGVPFAEITIRYTEHLNFAVFRLPPLRLEYSRRAYLAPTS